ncbi:MAG: hypothetical protein ACE5GA_09095, partial [Candidatus Zixiibacteriota bacterium]
VGVINILNLNPPQRFIDVERSYDLYMNQYNIRGLDDPTIYKDENATGVLVSHGFGATRVFNEYVTLEAISGSIATLEALKGTGAWSDGLQPQLDSMYESMNGHNPADSTFFGQRAVEILDSMIARYPEFWLNYILMADYVRGKGDSARALQYLLDGEKNIAAFYEKSPDIANYAQDLGLIKHEIARALGPAEDQGREEQALELLWEGFYINMNSGMAYQKLIQYLYERQRSSDVVRATRLHADYKINLYTNANVKRILEQFGGLSFP